MSQFIDGAPMSQFINEAGATAPCALGPVQFPRGWTLSAAAGGERVAERDAGAQERP